MTKGKSVVSKRITPTVINKKELLLPKMEFLPLNDAGQGFYVKELGGKSLVDFYEFINSRKDRELTVAENIEIMVKLVFITACNADGTPYFASEAEANLFADTSIAQLALANQKAEELSGMGANKNLKNDLNLSSSAS